METEILAEDPLQIKSEMDTVFPTIPKLEELQQEINPTDFLEVQSSSFGEQIPKDESKDKKSAPIENTNLNPQSNSDKKQNQCQNGKKFWCPKCLRSFKSKRRFRIHKESPKAKCSPLLKPSLIKASGTIPLHLPSYNCFECLEKFPSKTALKTHIHKQHSSLTSKTDSKSKEMSKSNKKSESNSNTAQAFSVTFECRANTCSEVFYSPYALEQHERSHKPHPSLHFKCILCPQTCLTNTHLKRHMILHVKVTPFKCSRCSLYLNTRIGLIKHLREHDRGQHKKKVRKVEMDGKSDEEGEEERDPLEIPTATDPLSRPESRFQCDICVQSYLRKGDLAKHIRRRSKDAPIKCTRCPEQFCSVVTCTAHYKSTHGTHPFVCAHPGCLESFRLFSQLKAHTWKVHEPVEKREKIFKCFIESCREIFSRMEDLKIHHEEMHYYNITSNCDQRYPCPRPRCLASFTVKSSLQRHMAQKHSSVKPGLSIPETFPCPVLSCRRFFRTKYLRKRHTKNVHVDKETLECRECKASFKNSLGLLVHFEVNHGDEEEGEEGGDETEPEPEPEVSAFVKVEIEEELDVKPKIKSEAGVDNLEEWEAKGEYLNEEFPALAIQGQGEGEENCGMVIEDIKVIPDIDFLVS